MDSNSPPPLVSTKKRISPPINWGLGLVNRDTFKTIKVILMGQSGVGKSGEQSVFFYNPFILFFLTNNAEGADYKALESNRSTPQPFRSCSKKRLQLLEATHMFLDIEKLIQIFNAHN